MTVAEKPPKEEQAYALPSQQTLAEAMDLPLLDASGDKLSFRSLLESTTTERHLVVFIRHFYCGMCENYVRMLSSQLPPKTLAAASPSTTLSIIGCGAPACIPSYKERTSAMYDIYSDSARGLYLQLGMTASMDMGEKKPEYVQQSTTSVVLSSMYNVLSSGTRGITLQGGHPSQNGGEWLWERSRGSVGGGVEGAWELKWCKRMRNSRDHAEVAELRKVLGMGSVV